MNEQNNDGGPAFPMPMDYDDAVRHPVPGMSLRAFAAITVAGPMYAEGAYHTFSDCAEDAVELADVLLAELAKVQEPDHA